MKEQFLIYMEDNHLDGFYVSNPVNVRYLSGFTGEDSSLYITNGRAYFITDLRYTEQAAIECPDFEIVNWRESGKDMGDTIAYLTEKQQVKTLGFESTHITFDTYSAIQQKLAAELIPQAGVIENIRSVKSSEEIKYSRAACDIASRAFDKICRDIRVGITEKEIASRLSHYMVMEGADTKPYGGIVISGARTSLLHGIPSGKVIEYGDFVLMDYGCQFKGYLSDMTRTVVVGRADDRQKEVYKLEQQMVAGVEAVLRPGITCNEAYEASLKAITDTEYMQYHYAGIGHGVGLFVHEPPFMGPGGKSVIKANQVITVEPGIYIPGWGGVRIEDQVLITDNGCENLISATKELVEL